MKKQTFIIPFLFIQLFSLPLFAKSFKHEKDFPIDQRELKRGQQDLVSYSKVIDNILPSIVSVFPSKILRDGESSKDGILKRYFGEGGKEGDEKKEQKGVGSGVIVSKDGYIITNHHVVSSPSGQMADELMIELSDRRQYIAKLIGVDEKTDIAVLKIEAENLKALPIADSDKVKVGDMVFAAGNPFRVGLTVTRGMISAKKRSHARSKGKYTSFLQTDAPINPGNSGGALVDHLGRLVGINQSIISQGGGSVGIGFAVPSNLARRVMLLLLEYGEINHGFAGIKVKEVDHSISKKLGMKKISGVIIENAPENLPGASAGLRKGDVILKIEGKEIEYLSDFRIGVAYAIPGEKLNIEILREGKIQNLPVTIESRKAPAKKVTTTQQFLEGVMVKMEGDKLLVVEVKEDSPFSSKISKGVHILEVNNKVVKAFREASQAIKIGVNKIKVLKDGNERVLALRIKKQIAKIE